MALVTVGIRIATGHRLPWEGRRASCAPPRPRPPDREVVKGSIPENECRRANECKSFCNTRFLSFALGPSYSDLDSFTDSDPSQSASAAPAGGGLGRAGRGTRRPYRAGRQLRLVAGPPPATFQPPPARAGRVAGHPESGRTGDRSGRPRIGPWNRAPGTAGRLIPPEHAAIAERSAVGFASVGPRMHRPGGAVRPSSAGGTHGLLHRSPEKT